MSKSYNTKKTGHCDSCKKYTQIVFLRDGYYCSVCLHYKKKETSYRVSEVEEAIKELEGRYKC